MRSEHDEPLRAVVFLVAILVATAGVIATDEKRAPTVRTRVMEQVAALGALLR